MIPKALDQVIADDILALVTNGDEERRTMDFKRDLPGNADKDKNELRADVSSFANAGGGDLVFGIDEVDGKATAVPGLPDTDPDAEIRRIEGIIHANIDPRIPGVESQQIPIPGKGPVILVRVPKSWRGPHMVRVNDSFRMFGRNSKGKYILDAHEMRAAFAQSDDVPKQIRQWRDERLSMVRQGQTAMPMPAEGTFILHLVPLSAIATRQEVAAKALMEACRWFSPLYTLETSARINADGLLTYATSAQSEHVARTVCQVFRDGRIEAVWGSLVRTQQNTRLVFATAIEKALLERVPQYIQGLQAQSVPMPLSVHCTILGAKGAQVPNPTDDLGMNRNVIDREMLYLPDVLLESANDLAGALRPMFDAIWNAGGWSASPSYDANGVWRQLR